MTRITRDVLIESVKKKIGFEGADLRGLDLNGADLRGGVFRVANFRYTDMREANLEGADLRRANLRHVVLTGSNLTRADLREADLTHADLRGANLSGAKLEGAKIGGARGVSEKVFFTQKMLDSLNNQRKIELSGNVLTILTGAKPSFNLEVAYRFIIVEGGGEDAHNLLGKVKTEQELALIKAEVYRDSALVGDVAYRIEPGFIGIPVKGAGPPAVAPMAAPAPTPVKKPPPAPPPQPAKPEGPPSKKSDEELLADFFLKNL